MKIFISAYELILDNVHKHMPETGGIFEEQDGNSNV